MNVLAPGLLQLEMTEQYPDGYLDAMMPRVLTRPEGRPRGAGRGALFLASDASGYVTGEVLPSTAAWSPTSTVRFTCS